MTGLGAFDLIYAVALLAYIALVAQRRLGRETMAWKLKAAGAWLLIFAGLFVVSSHLGWRLP